MVEKGYMVRFTPESCIENMLANELFTLKFTIARIS